MLGNQHQCVWWLLLVQVMIRAAWFSIRCTFTKSVVLILERRALAQSSRDVTRVHTKVMHVSNVGYIGGNKVPLNPFQHEVMLWQGQRSVNYKQSYFYKQLYPDNILNYFGDSYDLLGRLQRREINSDLSYIQLQGRKISIFGERSRGSHVSIPQYYKRVIILVINICRETSQNVYFVDQQNKSGCQPICTDKRVVYVDQNFQRRQEQPYRTVSKQKCMHIRKGEILLIFQR